MFWLCLHFPDLPLELFARGGRGGAFALTVGRAARRAIFRASAEALGAGVRPGMALSAALALVPDLVHRSRDEAAEAGALEALATWAGQFTSLVSLSEAPFAALLLEVEGSLALFGGREALLETIQEGVRELGYRAFSAAAPTPLGAELLARAGVEAWVPSLPELAGRLDPLPLRVLGLPPEVQRTFGGLGLRTLRDCRRLPPAGVHRRFGPELANLLARAYGRAPDPRKPFVPPPRFDARLELPAEVFECEALLFAARRLLLELEGFLKARGTGAEAFSLRLFGADRSSLDLEVELATPGRDPARLLHLLRERLGRVPLPGPISAVGLSAGRLAPLPAQEPDFFDPAGAAKAGAGGLLLERLRARLGRGAVQGLRAVEDHRPERSFSREPFPPAPSSGAEADAALFPPRPLWLLPDPEPLPTEGLTLLSGPERIETGWWDGSIARDYYVAEDANGARLWIFRSTESIPRMGSDREAHGGAGAIKIPRMGSDREAHGRARAINRVPGTGYGEIWFLHGYFA